MKRILLLLAAIALVSCKNDTKTGTVTEAVEQTSNKAKELLDRAKVFFQPISYVDIKVPNADEVLLGQHLFYDTRLSGEGNISCSSCHDLHNYGVDNLALSPGDAEGTFGTRNSPTVIHASLHNMQFWDGRAADVEEQAAGPILNPLEHNIKSEAELEAKLKDVELYQDMFTKVYGENSITFNNITRAIGAFERTLIPEGRFDKFLEGDLTALNEQEQRGLGAFIDQGCITCHSGVALGGQMLQKFGLYHDYWLETDSEVIDLGVYEIGNNESQKYFFKVPGLRNVAKTGPYFHDGSVDDLNKTVAIMGKLQRGVNLTDNEIEDIVAFFDSLTADVHEEAKQNPFDK